MEFAFNGDGKATVVTLETMEGRGSSLNFTWNEQGKKKMHFAFFYTIQIVSF